MKLRELLQEEITVLEDKKFRIKHDFGGMVLDIIAQGFEETDGGFSFYSGSSGPWAIEIKWSGIKKRNAKLTQIKNQMIKDVKREISAKRLTSVSPTALAQLNHDVLKRVRAVFRASENKIKKYL